jgi:2-polyprenyl-3-methyl-5-hydroxy-6-metoxy-1,4-benzoquinol methylase
MGRVNQASHGTGPGAITPDGCAVEIYARMTATGEPAIAHGALRPGASILELGSGTGQLTHPLVALGQSFTATRLDETEMATVLGEAGLRLDRYLTDDHAWLRVVPAG